MKLNNNIKTIVIATSTAVLLSACGGGGSKKDPVTPTPVVTGKIVKCDTDTYSALKKNDKITALQDATEVTVRHSEDGT